MYFRSLPNKLEWGAGIIIRSPWNFFVVIFVDFQSSFYWLKNREKRYRLTNKHEEYSTRKGKKIAPDPKEFWEEKRYILKNCWIDVGGLSAPKPLYSLCILLFPPPQNLNSKLASHSCRFCVSANFNL